MLFDPSKIKNFPTEPGVYIMKDRQGEVLYVGKAKNIKQRVRQYFAIGGDGRSMVPFLISHILTIDTVVVTSEKEALILELNLIKKYQPKYNALFKDDKSYIALKLTKHQWPRIDIVRYRGKPKSDGFYFGPYTNAFSARKTLDLLQKIFPMRQCSDKEFSRRTRPCILYDMKRCIAPCVGKCTQEEYDVLVERSKRFLQGQDKEIITELYSEMKKYSDQLEYEKAGDVLRTIRHIEKTIEKQKVAKPLGNDLDIIGVFREGDEVILILMFFREGTLTGTRHYSFSNIMDDDHDLLSSFILQHYSQDEEIPHEILIPEEIEETEALSELIATNSPRKVSIYVPKKGEKLELIKLAKINAEATFRKEKDENTIRERILLSLQEKFRLIRYPRRIECFDVSNISGTETVATMIAFTDGLKDSSRYRKYKIRTAETSDDYGAMYEVLMRRFKRAKEENDLPDLLIVDGGKGHLNVALKVMKELNLITVDLIALAKEQGRHDRGMTSEQVFLPNVKDPVILKRNSPILFLLQKIRDEAHRTAISFQKGRRSKSMIKSSLDEIPGIGPVKKKILLRYFGSLKALKEAAKEEIAAVKGISAKDAETVYNALHSMNGAS
jgi:excinuclease ABC subunit C